MSAAAHRAAQRLLATAARLIDKNGHLVTYTHITTGAYDPATSVSAVTKTAVPVRAMVTFISKRDTQEGQNGEIALTILGTALDPKPQLADRFLEDGTEYAVSNISKELYGDTVILWYVKGMRI